MLDKMILSVSLFAVLLIGSLSVLPMADAVLRQGGLDPSTREFECRTGQVLVFNFNANNQICTSSSNAEMWERLGLARILESSTETVTIEQPTIPRETKPAVVGTAETIFRNGIVYTVDDENPWAQAFAVRDGIFIGVGSNDEMNRFAGARSQTVDLQGRMVLPGFFDTHQHWDAVGMNEQSCTLPGSFENPTKESTKKKIEECAAAGNDFNGWFVGMMLSESIFTNGPHKEFLDEIFPDRPAFLESESGHNALINSKGLEVLGITKDTVAPAGGEYDKDDNGELTGFIIEDPAREHVLDQIPFPPKDPNFFVDGFKIAMSKANANGITGFTDARTQEQHLASWERFLKENDPTIRGGISILAIGYGGPGTELYGKDIIEMTKDYDFKDWPVLAKIFADGTTEGENTALLEPYKNDPQKDHKKLSLPDDLYKKVLMDLDENDIQMKIHANGDRSVRITLDIIEEIVGERGYNKHRHHIAHNALVDAEDIPRYHKIGVPAEWLAPLGTPSLYYKSQLPILGEDRWFEKTYPMGSIHNDGGIVAIGSDWPITPDNPFYSIQAAVTRQDPSNPENEMVLNEKHKLSLPAAIQMYTLNGAYVMHLEKIAGSIEDGKSADFIVIDRDIFDVPDNEIKDTQILQTFFEGKQVYKK